MSGFTAWIMSITGAVCLGALADILMSEGATKKYVKGIVALIVFAVILAPVPAILSGDLSFGLGEYTDAENSAFVNDVTEARYRNAEYALETALATCGYDNADVRIYLSYGNSAPEILQVIVDITGSVIIEGEANINIREEVAEFTAEALNTEPYRVSVIY